MTKILYVSSLCSEKMVKYFFETSVRKPEQAAQKFHRLLVQGFTMHDKICKIETLSVLPIVPELHRKKFWFLPTETVDNIKYRYIPLINLPFLNNIVVFFIMFLRVFFWNVLSIGKSRVVICDILKVTATAAAILACKLTFTKIVTIVPDLPGLIVINIRKNNSKTFDYLYRKIVLSSMHRFSGYILLTEQMNSIVNPNKKPYLIMEGLVDINMGSMSNNPSKKTAEKILIYAGGLYEKYGVQMLIDAFMLLKDSAARLHLYGSGELVSEMDSFTKKDNRIIYKGMVPNKIVVQDQLGATLLVNPRPSTEEFTKYSFPSKNMEYMVSGTPMVTTRLPGMPDEYLDYVFTFEEESIEGMSRTLASILSKPEIELNEFGARAKKFVLTEKSNSKQTQKILEFLKKL